MGCFAFIPNTIFKALKNIKSLNPKMVSSPSPQGLTPTPVES